MIVAATPDAVARAAAHIRAGGVVAFPTETVYGLGADATNALAVARLFEIKHRPSFDPLIVHVSASEELPALVTAIPPAVHELAARFWPGPLTVILPKTERIPDIVTAGLPSVAVRVPDHPVALELIRRAARPIAAPSANRFGYVSPTAAAHVAEQLGHRVEIILDGGSCRVGIESTVVSFLAEPPQLLRAGGITLEDLEAVIGRVAIPTARQPGVAPGQLDRHYAPHTPVDLVESPAAVPERDRCGAALLLVQPTAYPPGFARVEVLAEDGELRRAAANLFAALRRLDAGGFTRIYAVAIPERGLGRAIMDRLQRAAA